MKELSSLVAFAILLVGAAAWWAFYVHPHDQFMGEILACMEYNSRAEFSRCESEVSDSHQHNRLEW